MALGGAIVALAGAGVLAFSVPGLQAAGSGAVAVALVLLGAAAASLMRRSAPAESTSVLAPPEASDDGGPPPDAAAAGEALLRFARELTRSASMDHVQQVIARQLPPLLDVERAWVVARLADRQHVIVPESSEPGADRAPLVSGADRADWATFPLRIGSDTVGVLGVEVTGRRLSAAALHAIREVSPMLAHALATAHTIGRLRETSILDPLTGCSTRAHGAERLAIELKRAERSGRSLALLMVDIDHFKDVNDRFGHSAGDAVLTAIGRTMMQTLRASDVRCRWGGEEFLVVLPESAVEEARRVAEALLRRIAESAVHTKAGPIRVTASIGVTVARPGEHDIETLIARADRALYRAKGEGRGCVRIVLGDMKGAPIGGPVPAPALPFRDRRDPTRTDRRSVPGPGRRKTDRPSMAGRAPERIVSRSAGDRATPR